MKSVSLPESVEQLAEPNPAAAARRMASWRSFRGFSLKQERAGAGGRGEEDQRSAGFPNGLRVRDGGAMGRGGDVLSRAAFEALLPCIFHADAVHDEVGDGSWLSPLHTMYL